MNVSAIEEYKEVKARYDALMHQVTDVEESRNELTRMISKLSAQMREIFSDSFRAINENFGRVFTELFGGGEASLVLEDESDVLSCGIGIRVAPPGKVIKNLEALSGGEQALVAISIYFAILAVNPAPFCILDEIEAALDDANVVRFAQYLRRVSDKTQFIVITHRRGTMEAANVLYGVTMQEDGVSKLLKLDLEQVDATLGFLIYIKEKDRRTPWGSSDLARKTKKRTGKNENGSGKDPHRFLGAISSTPSPAASSTMICTMIWKSSSSLQMWAARWPCVWWISCATVCTKRA